MRKLIGHCSVDSGQLIIVDPSYLRKWINNMPFGHPILKDTKTNKHYTCCNFDPSVHKYAVMKQFNATPFDRYDNIIEGETVNDHMASGRFIALPNPPPVNLFSYAGSCHVTGSEQSAGEIEHGVAISTGYGDGMYPVYATYKNGIIAKIEIDFGVNDPKEN